MLVASLIVLASSFTQQGPPLFGYMKGETVASGTVAIGGADVSTGIKGDGVATFIVHVSGVGNSPGGRSLDALYNFANPTPAAALPMQTRMIRLLIGNSNSYKDFEFWIPVVGDSYPAYRDDHNYDFLWRPSPGDEIKVTAPATKYTNPTEDVVSGSYSFTIYKAVQGDGKSSGSATFNAVDCRDYQAMPAPQFPAMAEPTAFWLGQMATYYDPIKGVAADGVTLVLLRAIVDTPSKATFSVSMRTNAKSFGAGALFPLVGNPEKSAGNSSIEVSTRPLGNKKFCAFAIYRPPVAFGAGDDRDLTFTVQFKNEDGSDGPKQDLNLKLVRPPVILVHGTYDNPKACYQEIEALDDAEQSMEDWLKIFRFHHIFCLDWKEWNGSKDPSDFVTNEKRVWDGTNGIREALAAMRADGIACTQADLVCHSQGGAIARVYARGYSLQRPPVRMPSDHPHFHNPQKCMEMGCWYHRIDNYATGDIHRLITISTTHRGSAVCNLFVALGKYVEEKQATGEWIDKARSAIVGLFQKFVDKHISGVTTGGFFAQVPGSDQLKALGPTPVASHAIACCCSNDEMRFTRPDDFWVAYGLTRGLGNYFGKMFLVRSLVPNDAQIYAFHKIAEFAQDDPHLTVATKNKLPQLADRYETLLKEYSKGPNDEDKNAELIFLVRQIVFQDDENDCTVAVHSSYGGLEAPYITKVDHTLHGWAPRSKSVQNKVLDILCDGGGLLDPNGFPDSFYGDRTEAGTFVTPTSGASFTPPPTDNGNAGLGVNPGTSPGTNPAGNKPDPRFDQPHLSLKQTVIDPGTIDKKIWTFDESGTATMRAPWGTVTYKIMAPKNIFDDNSQELVFEIQATPIAGQRMSSILTARGDEVEREPSDRELNVYVESGASAVTKSDRKVFKVKPSEYSKQIRQATIWVTMTDGPSFYFKYGLETGGGPTGGGTGGGETRDDSKIAAAVVGHWDWEFAIPAGTTGPGYLHMNADGTMAWQTTGESGTWKVSNGKVILNWKKDGVVATLNLTDDGKILDGTDTQGIKVRYLRSGGGEEEPPHVSSGASAKYAGDYQTDFGKMTITINNGSIKGTIEGGKGDFHGTITGTNLVLSGTIVGTKCTGEIEFSADGSSFKGFYIDPDGPTKIEFTGTRIKALAVYGPTVGLDSGNHFAKAVVLVGR